MDCVKMTYDFVYKAFRLAEMFGPESFLKEQKENFRRTKIEMPEWPEKEDIKEIDNLWDEFSPEIFESHPWLKK